MCLKFLVFWWYLVVPQLVKKQYYGYKWNGRKPILHFISEHKVGKKIYLSKVSGRENLFRSMEVTGSFSINYFLCEFVIVVTKYWSLSCNTYPHISNPSSDRLEIYFSNWIHFFSRLSSLHLEDIFRLRKRRHRQCDSWKIIKWERPFHSTEKSVRLWIQE